MFLVHCGDRSETLRLVSLKTNPWLKFDHEESYSDSDFIHKHTIFMFTGSLYEIPNEENS